MGNVLGCCAGNRTPATATASIELQPIGRPITTAPSAELRRRTGARNAASEAPPRVVLPAVAAASSSSAGPRPTKAIDDDVSPHGIHASSLAPIRPLEGTALTEAIAKFEAQLTTVPRTAPADQRSDQQLAWRKRLLDTATALHYVKAAAGAERSHHGFFVGSMPAGLMSLKLPPDNAPRRQRHVEIEALVTHPLTEGAGGALVEHAVNVSQERGLNGIVRLQPQGASMDSPSMHAYQALGFTGNEDLVTLDPVARPDMWSKQDGRWQITRHIGKKFIDDGLKNDA